MACLSPASPRRPSSTILNSPGRQSVSLSGSFAGIASASSPGSSPLPLLAQRAGSMLADDCCASTTGVVVGGDSRRVQLSKSGHWKPVGAVAVEALQSQTHRALQQLHAAQHSVSSRQRDSLDGRGRGELRRRTSESQLHDLRASCQGEVQHWAEEAAKMRQAGLSRPVVSSDAGCGTAQQQQQQQQRRSDGHNSQQGSQEQNDQAGWL